MHHRDPLMALRLRRGVEHLHCLGARAVAEFLAEIGDRADCALVIAELLAEYEARLTVEMIAATKADRFPPRPLRQVG